MIGGSAIGARPVAAFRLVFAAAAAVSFTVVAAGGGASQVGLVKSVGLSPATAGGGSVFAEFNRTFLSVDPASRRRLSGGGTRVTFGGGNRGRAGG
jgi:hypothetical protein